MTYMHIRSKIYKTVENWFEIDDEPIFTLLLRLIYVYPIQIQIQIRKNSTTGHPGFWNFKELLHFLFYLEELNMRP